MHDKINTVYGQFGFIAEYADGSTRSEFDLLWDELPGEPVTGLSLVDLINDNTDMVLGRIADFERYYFSNEAVCSGTSTLYEDGELGTRYQGAILVAKTIGGIRGDFATEYRLDISDPTNPTVSKRTYPATEVKFAPHAMKVGIVK